ncbi:MAG: bifunctional DNA primase/polymerase [Candidatus Bathyarchaeia archaeon]
MSETVEAARGYWALGLPVVPLKGKQPLVGWAKWQSQLQTNEEFESLPWAEADGFAIICGSKAQSGLFFGAIDFDVKNLGSEAIEKGREALKHLPITQIEETPSKGQHWIYWSHTKPKSISAYHNICGLELLGEGKLCIMSPSEGYRKLNDNTPTEVQDLEAVFYEALRRVGVEVRGETWFSQSKAVKGLYRGPSPPCIKALLEGVAEGIRNESAIRLASYLLNFRGLSRSKALAKLKAQDKVEEILHMLNPIWHTCNDAQVKKYQAEPYVLAGDVYSLTSFEGKGGWTWYTGAASWFYIFVLEYVLGIKIYKNHLVIDPCPPASWDNFRARVRKGTSIYHIRYKRSQHVSNTTFFLDGKKLKNSEIPIVDDGKEHEVIVHYK